MALDKLLDSARLDAALGHTADRIRARGGSSAPLPFDLAGGKGFGDAIDALPGVRVEELVYVPQEDLRHLSFPDPRPAETPKLVTIALDEASYSGERTNMMAWSLFTTLLCEPVRYQSYDRWPSWMYYYNANGVLTTRAQGTQSGYAAGLSAPRGTVASPGYNSSYNVYKAGASYKIQLYYWEDGA